MRIADPDDGTKWGGGGGGGGTAPGPLVVISIGGPGVLVEGGESIPYDEEVVITARPPAPRESSGGRVNPAAAPREGAPARSRFPSGASPSLNDSKLDNSRLAPKPPGPAVTAMPDWTTQTEWAFPAPDRRLIQPITSVDTGSRPLNFLLNKILLPWSNAAAFSTNVKLAMIIGLEDALRDIDDALSHSIFGQEYRAAQALLPMNAAMGLAIEVGPAMEFMAAQMTTWWSTFSRSPRVLNAFLFPVFSTLGADTGSISSLGRAIEGTLPPESFAGVINEAEFSSHPAVIDRLSRARQFDVGGYKSLTGKGEYGRPFDHLDSDEALQNAFVRNVRDVNRTDPMLADNPATALSPALHQQIRNLTAVEMEGMSAEQVLRFHIEQMRPFTPDYVLVVLENLSLAYIRMNGL